MMKMQQIKQWIKEETVLMISAVLADDRSGWISKNRIFYFFGEMAGWESL